MQTLAEILDETPVFHGLPAETLELIAGCAKNEAFTEGTVIVEQGDPADAFLLVRRGRVALELHAPSRGPLVIETIDPGEIVGWSWLFPPYRWHLAVRALDDVGAVSFDGACLRGKLERDHALGFELMRRFARIVIDRLEHTELRLLDVYASVRD
ncbi:MAG: cyclic nucleotide-binding domain-containing protein [Gaiellales bacterium]